MGDHTETFQVDYDPKQITYEKLLDIFWASHNPCGGGGSRQYRSAIFTMNDEQKKLAEESLAKVAAVRGDVTTAIEPLTAFTRAEDYHQKYSLRHSRPLMEEFRAMYPKDEDFVNSTAAARVNAYIAGDGTKEQLEKEIDRLGLSEEGKAELRKYVAR
jgi:peptide methionine sulfoxide reductase MsrA